MNINDMLDPTKRPMLTVTERTGINNVAESILTPMGAPYRVITITDDMTIPFGMVLKAGLEALK